MGSDGEIEGFWVLWSHGRQVDIVNNISYMFQAASSFFHLWLPLLGFRRGDGKDSAFNRGINSSHLSMGQGGIRNGAIMTPCGRLMSSYGATTFYRKATEKQFEKNVLLFLCVVPIKALDSFCC